MLPLSERAFRWSWALLTPHHCWLQLCACCLTELLHFHIPGFPHETCL